MSDRTSNHRSQTLRKTTIDLLNQIAEARGWKIVEAAERAAKALAKQEKIAVTAATAGTRAKPACRSAA